MRWKCSSSPTHLTPSLSYFTQLLIFEDRRARLGFSSLKVDVKLRMRSRCFPSKHASEPKKTVKLKAAFSFGHILCPQKNTCFPLASTSSRRLTEEQKNSIHREENTVSNKRQITSLHTKPPPNLGLGKVFQRFGVFFSWGRPTK